MISSFAISVFFFVIGRGGVTFGTHQKLFMTVAFTTACWLLTAFFSPETDRATLIDFYKKVRPFGPGWTKIRRAAGISDQEAAEHAKNDNIPLALLGWTTGSIAIWSALFTVGNFLYGRMTYTAILFGVFVVSGLGLIRVVRRLWA